MIVTVVLEGRRLATYPPAPGAPHVALRAEQCPACGREGCAARGLGVARHDRDTYYAPGQLVCCGAAVEIQARVDTLFGIEEDEAILVHGRARVYS